MPTSDYSYLEAALPGFSRARLLVKSAGDDLLTRVFFGWSASERYMDLPNNRRSFRTLLAHHSGHYVHETATYCRSLDPEVA